jgi:hypothetical protein
MKNSKNYMKKGKIVAEIDRPVINVYISSSIHGSLAISRTYDCFVPNYINEYKHNFSSDKISFSAYISNILDNRSSHERNTSATDLNVFRDISGEYISEADTITLIKYNPILKIFFITHEVAYYLNQFTDGADILAHTFTKGSHIYTTNSPIEFQYLGLKVVVYIRDVSTFYPPKVISIDQLGNQVMLISISDFIENNAVDTRSMFKINTNFTSSVISHFLTPETSFAYFKPLSDISLEHISQDRVHLLNIDELSQLLHYRAFVIYKWIVNLLTLSSTIQQDLGINIGDTYDGDGNPNQFDSLSEAVKRDRKRLNLHTAPLNFSHAGLLCTGITTKDDSGRHHIIYPFRHLPHSSAKLTDDLFGTYLQNNFNAEELRFLDKSQATKKTMEKLKTNRYLSKEGFFGGRIDCFQLGLTENTNLYYYDLSGAYGRVIMLLNTMDFSTLDNINQLPESPQILNTHYLVARTYFEFPKTCLYPCLSTKDARKPKDTSVAVYPRSGYGIFTGHELYQARKQGAIFKEFEGSIIERGNKRPFEVPLRILVGLKERATDPAHRSLYKLLINSVYGKIAQGVSYPHQSFANNKDLASNYNTKDDASKPPRTKSRKSLLYSPQYACHIAGIIRATVSAKIVQITEQGYKVHVVNTDGLITNMPPEVFSSYTTSYDNFLKSAPHHTEELWQLRNHLKSLLVVNSRICIGTTACSTLPSLVTLPGYTPFSEERKMKNDDFEVYRSHMLKKVSYALQSNDKTLIHSKGVLRLRNDYKRNRISTEDPSTIPWKNSHDRSSTVSRLRSHNEANTNNILLTQNMGLGNYISLDSERYQLKLAICMYLENRITRDQLQNAFSVPRERVSQLIYYYRNKSTFTFNINAICKSTMIVLLKRLVSKKKSVGRPKNYNVLAGNQLLNIPFQERRLKLSFYLLHTDVLSEEQVNHHWAGRMINGDKITSINDLYKSWKNYRDLWEEDNATLDDFLLDQDILWLRVTYGIDIMASKLRQSNFYAPKNIKIPKIKKNYFTFQERRLSFSFYLMSKYSLNVNAVRDYWIGKVIKGQKLTCINLKYHQWRSHDVLALDLSVIKKQDVIWAQKTYGHNITRIQILRDRRSQRAFLNSLIPKPLDHLSDENAVYYYTDTKVKNTRDNIKSSMLEILLQLKPQYRYLHCDQNAKFGDLANLMEVYDNTDPYGRKSAIKGVFKREDHIHLQNLLINKCKYLNLYKKAIKNSFKAKKAKAILETLRVIPNPHSPYAIVLPCLVKDIKYIKHTKVDAQQLGCLTVNFKRRNPPELM